MTIDTREELINALHTACEIEHSLLVQYLYAAFSMKKGLDEGLTTRQQKLVRAWQAQILSVAREEMGHFGIVCNLLAAIGAPAKFDRPVIPHATGYYPFPFSLEPFGDQALYNFLVFELPRGADLPPPPGADLSERGLAEAAPLAFAPEPIEYEFVGELYAKIGDGFRNLSERELFIGPREAQSGNEWSAPDLDMRVATNRASALRAIDNIIEDGEGTPQSSENAHYHRFSRIRQVLFEAGRFPAARAVPTNPATRERPDAAVGSVTLIRNPASLALAELFGQAYGVMLLLLQHYFSMAPVEGDAARRELRDTLQLTSQRLMSVAVRPIAEELTRMPLNDARSPERAGPTFEIYSDVALTPYESARLSILLERFDSVIAGCRELAGEVPRLSAIADTLKYMRMPIEQVTGGDA